MFFSVFLLLVCHTKPLEALPISPFEYSSGSSIRGRNRVNPLADKKMKFLLHLLALTSIRHDPELKLYYERKKEDGKHSLLVLNNVKCKLVSRIFAVIKRETPYVKTHQFANWKYLKIFLFFDIEYVSWRCYLIFYFNIWIYFF